MGSFFRGGRHLVEQMGGMGWFGVVLVWYFMVVGWVACLFGGRDGLLEAGGETTDSFGWMLGRVASVRGDRR